VLADGAVTGKGLSDLIREEFGFALRFFLMAAILVVNLGNVMAEFTGVSGERDVWRQPVHFSAAGWLLVWRSWLQGTAKWSNEFF